MGLIRTAVGFLLLGAAVLVPAVAQQYVISTYAGGAPPPMPAPEWDVAIATDPAGNTYFTSMHCVYKRDRQGVVTRIAGTSRPGYSGDGGPATSAQLYDPSGLAADSAGNLFIADSFNHRVRRISTDGIIVTVAGDGTMGDSGDGRPATAAQLSYPISVAVDGAGNLFVVDAGFDGFSDYGNLVRKVSAQGIITTVAGGGPCCSYSSDGVPAVGADLTGPNRVAVDGAGNLYITEPLTGRVRKVSPDGILTTVAGSLRQGTSQLGTSCGAGSGGNGKPATQASLCLPYGIAVDSAGNLFIAEYGYRCCYDIDDPIIENFAVRQVAPDGIIGTVTGSATPGITGCDCADIGSGSVAVDGDGNMFISDSVLIRKVSPDGSATTIADSAASCCFSGDGGAATAAQLHNPTAVATDGAGNLFIADTDNSRVRKVSPDGTITTVAGTGTYGFSGDGGLATNAQLWDVTSLAVDGAGNLFISDTRNYRVRKVAPDGTITTVAGGGTEFGDGGQATSASLYPIGVAVDGAGNLFIVDALPRSYRVRKVSPSGTITTVAGGGQNSPADGQSATSVFLNPRGLAVDGSDNLFIVDGTRVWRVSADGILTKAAGTGSSGYSGDGGPATGAQLSTAWAVAVDGAGSLFIAEGGRIRKVSSDGIITTIAGAGGCCYYLPAGQYLWPSSSGDGGPAITAQLFPVGVAVDGAGNVYGADSNGNVIRILRPTNASVLMGAVVDAASQKTDPLTPGKIVVIYGAGLGPAQLVGNQPDDASGGGLLGADLGGTKVSFNGIAAPILYTSATQVAVVVPYAITGTTAQVSVSYQGQVSPALTLPVAPSRPSLFTVNQTGAGQAAVVNAADGTANTAANPAKPGDSILLYATGEGQTTPAGVDGKLGGSIATHPLLPVKVTIGGVPAAVQYAGGVQNQVAGLMQVNVQIPSGVQPGGYVPVVLQVGDQVSSPAVWIAISGN